MAARKRKDVRKSSPSKGMAENKQDDTKSSPPQVRADFDKLKLQQYYEELQERLLQSRQDTASTQVRSSTSGRKKPRRGTGSSSSPGYLPPEKKNDAGSQDALIRPKDVEKL